MTAICNTGLKASGVGLVSLLVFGLAGIAGADAGPEPSVGPWLEDFEVLATSVRQVPATPGAVSPSSSACRVITTPFELDEESDEVVWTRLQNAGTGAATIYALELGWRGEMVLREVAAKQPDGNLVAVYEEPATSPALLSMRAPAEHAAVLTLEPGSTLDIAIAFDKPLGAEVLDEVVSALFYLEEGCMAAVARAADTDRYCPLLVGPIQVKPTEPRIAWFGVENDGAESTQLATLEVAWPVRDNGRLVALHLGDDVHHEFDPGKANSPAVIDLRRIGVKQRELPADDQLLVGLEFESRAAAQHYAVTVTSRDGCVASTSTYASAANPDCGVDVVGFEVTSHSAHLRLANGRAYRRVVSSIEAFWPVESAGGLTEVRVNGAPVWSGAASESPARLALAGASLPARSTSDLQLIFSPERDERSPISGHTGGDYTIVATLKGGCQLAYSTLAGRPLGCSVSASEVAVDPADREAWVSLANAAADATLRRLAISWPARNGPLTLVEFDGRPLLDPDAEVAPSAQPFVIELRNGTLVIPRNSTKELRLGFRDRASRNGYMMSLEFEDPRGEPCQLLVSSREVRPDCRIGLGPPSLVDFRYVELELQNQGRDEVEIRFVTVDWPNTDHVNGISQVALVDPARPEPLIVWQSDQERTMPPVQVTPNGSEPPIIDAGKTVRLRLRFVQLLKDAMATPREVMKVTVGTVEECQASYSRDGEQPSPDLVAFGGVIRELPLAADGSGMFGTWVIESLGRRRPVEVDRATRIDPSTVTPRVGDLVQVEAIGLEEDKLRAVAITFLLGEPWETFNGVIVDMDREHEPPSWIQVLDRHVYLVDGTRVDGGELEVNAEVAVDGKLNPDGTVTAIRITVNKPPEGVEVEFAGVIQSKKSSTQLDGEDWAVDKYIVAVPRRFLPDGSNPDPALRPEEGKRVLITGQLEGRRVRATKMPEILRAPVTERVYGTLLELPAGGVLGQWRVATGSGELGVTVDSLAIVDSRSAPVEVGMAVDAVVEVLDDERYALRLRMEWP